MARVLVCGGRDYGDQERVIVELDAYHALEPITAIIEGGASGADEFARSWAIGRRVRNDTYRAEWGAFGLRAGPIRNYRMLADGKPDVVIAFPGGKGTANMVKQAKKAGVPVLRVEP